jgi:calcium-dependent protein kinase
MISELQMLQKLSHPNIMNVLELLESNENYYIVTELLEGGELFERLLEVKNYNEAKAAHIMNQVLLAVNYMHRHKMVHRDLKPQNILISNLEKLEVKLADFGFSCVFDPK